MQHNISEDRNIFLGLSEFIAGTLAGRLILSPALLHTQANPPAIRASRSSGREDTETAGSRRRDSKCAAHDRLCSTGIGCNETTGTLDQGHIEH